MIIHLDICTYMRVYKKKFLEVNTSILPVLISGLWNYKCFFLFTLQISKIFYMEKDHFYSYDCKFV